MSSSTSVRASSKEKTDVSVKALVSSPEHHTLAIPGSHLGESASALTIEFPATPYGALPEDRKMDDLTYILRQLCKRNRSRNTQADRMPPLGKRTP